VNAEQADLKARFAAPGERDLPPGRHLLHRDILMNRIVIQAPASKTTGHGGSHSRRAPARMLAAVAAGVAVAAGLAGYAITAGNAPAVPQARGAATRPATSHARGQAARQAVLAAKLLRAAAAHLTRAVPATEPSPGQWIYYKTVSYGYPNLVEPSGVTTYEEWITFDGSQTAYYQNGQIVTHTSPAPPPGPGVNPWTAWNTDATPKTAYDALAALPASPQALLKVIARQAAGQNAQNIAAGNPIAGVTPKTEAQREFDYLTLILWNAAVGIPGPPAAEAAAYQAMASLPGITVQQGIKDTAGGQAIGVSDDGGYDQLLIDPVSYQVIGIRQFSTGIGPRSIAQAVASGRIPPALRKMLAGLTRAERSQLITALKKKEHTSAYPPKGTLMDETVYTQAAEVPAPGDR
jgi:hypothetical protein